MSDTVLRFPRKDETQFFKTLNQRVNNYFKENNLKKTGNWKLHLKTIVMISVFLTPYFLLLTLNISQWWMLALTVLIGVGMAGVGMNVMHDGNHGTYSSKKWLNQLMGGSIYILSGNVYNWKVQHNVLHHTYTNITGHDEDLEAGKIMRFSKESPWKRFHKYQHYYSVFLYGLLTINWAILADFKQMKRYIRRGLSAEGKLQPMREWSILVITKIIYLTIWIVLPILLMDIAWWKILIGFFVMHFVAGVILSVVFQLAHVTHESVTMPAPEDGQLKNIWAIHQLKTTANFGTRNRIVNWFTGGLNHQVEHHIFPHISHIHYKKISEIVKKTAREFNLPYHEFRTTRAAIAAHFTHLRNLGKGPEVNFA